MPLPQEISTSGCLGGSRTMRSLLVALHAMAASSSASCSSSAVQPTEQASAHAAASMAASSSAASPTSALQPTEQAIASKASSSGAPHPAEVDVTDMWTRIQKFGRFPQRVRAPDSEAEREENALLDFLEKEKTKGSATHCMGRYAEVRCFSARRHRAKAAG